MFWCRDIGLAKRLLGYSVWLLGSGLAASNHDTPKASCQYEWYKPTPTPLWHSEWKIILCEFWLLRCSTMVARAWPVSVEVIQDWLLAAHFMGRPTPLKVNGATLGRSCPPGVQLLPHFEVWSYRACQPLQMWQISHFCEIHSLSYEASKFFAMLSLCVFFWPLFRPWGEHRTPDRL